MTISRVRCLTSRSGVSWRFPPRRLAAIPFQSVLDGVIPNRAVLWTIWTVLWIMGSLAYFAEARAQTPTLVGEEKLIAEFTDPLTTLPQISIKDAFTPANFGTHVQTNQVIVRPIIPRVPRFSLFPFVQLIRPSLSLVTTPSPRGGTRTEFGDMQLLDVAVLPWPPRETGSSDRDRSNLRVSNRDFQERRARGLAGRPGIGSRLQGRTLAGGRFYSPGSDFFRLHVAQPPASKHTRVSANSSDSSLARLVFAIRGSDLGVRLASSFANCIAPESWARRRDSSSRFAATQFLCDGAVDSVSTICANCASDRR